MKRGRGSEKTYGSLFSCLNRRAVHIEDVSSVETNAFTQAFFQGFSQPVAVILKENGTNFVKADNEFHWPIWEWTQDELNKRLIKDEITSHLCPRSEWKKRPTASHVNGVWKRLIRSVRKSIWAILGNQSAQVCLFIFIIIIISTFSFPLSSVSYLVVIYFMFISKKILLN